MPKNLFPGKSTIPQLSYGVRSHYYNRDSALPDKALVAANRELIERFEKKIQATIARVWGDDESTPLGEA